MGQGQGPGTPLREAGRLRSGVICAAADARVAQRAGIVAGDPG